MITAWPSSRVDYLDVPSTPPLYSSGVLVKADVCARTSCITLAGVTAHTSLVSFHAVRRRTKVRIESGVPCFREDSAIDITVTVIFACPDFPTLVLNPTQFQSLFPAVSGLLLFSRGRINTRLLETSSRPIGGATSQSSSVSRTLKTRCQRRFSRLLLSHCSCFTV